MANALSLASQLDDSRRSFWIRPGAPLPVVLQKAHGANTFPRAMVDANAGGPEVPRRPPLPGMAAVAGGGAEFTVLVCARALRRAVARPAPRNGPRCSLSAPFWGQRRGSIGSCER